MALTIIYDELASVVPGAGVSNGELVLPGEALERSTGWVLKREGACLGDLCVPLPEGLSQEKDAKNRSHFNLSGLARLVNQPVVHDDEHGVWVFGGLGARWESTLQTLRAPDFTLPDLDGRMHSLSDHRGKKVFLYAWASW